MSQGIDLAAVHKHSRCNREEIARSVRCRCFHCMADFRPAAIDEWIDDDRTAMCPNCGIDSVIGDAAGFDLTPDLLQRMNRYYF